MDNKTRPTKDTIDEPMMWKALSFLKSEWYPSEIVAMVATKWTGATSKLDSSSLYPRPETRDGKKNNNE